MSKPSFYLENLGCAKNQVDAEIIISELCLNGWEHLEASEHADLIIINTCSFIVDAREESIEISLAAKRKYPEKKVLISGCLSQRYGKRLSKSMPEIDGFFGNRDLSQIPGLAAQIVQGNRSSLFPVIGVEKHRETPFPHRTQLIGSKRSAYVKVAEGCNNRCAYCAIPEIRGALRSRDRMQIIEEIRNLLAEGVFEIILIAQDLASYGVDGGRSDLVRLIAEILEIPTDFWLRCLYIHPDHFMNELLDLCVKDPRLLPYFDLPFQHVSKKILTNMDRRGSKEHYAELLERIRARLPDAIIRSTFLLGFPGEGKENFEELLEFQEEAKIDWLGIFTYSPEKGTPAYKVYHPLICTLSKPRIEKRRLRILGNQERISQERMNRFVGKELQVLIEEKVRDGLHLGRAFLHAPSVDGCCIVRGLGLEIGTIKDCDIVRRNGIDLEAHAR